MYRGFAEIANDSESVAAGTRRGPQWSGNWVKTRRADGPRFISRSKVRARSEPCREVADVQPGSLRFCRSKQSGREASVLLHHKPVVADEVGAWRSSPSFCTSDNGQAFSLVQRCRLARPSSLRQSKLSVIFVAWQRPRLRLIYEAVNGDDPIHDGVQDVDELLLFALRFRVPICAS